MSGGKNQLSFLKLYSNLRNRYDVNNPEIPREGNTNALMCIKYQTNNPDNETQSDLAREVLTLYIIYPIHTYIHIYIYIYSQRSLYKVLQI